MHYLYRLRVQANYVAADRFTEGPMTDRGRPRPTGHPPARNRRIRCHGSGLGGETNTKKLTISGQGEPSADDACERVHNGHESLARTGDVSVK